jgi:hypothetical protein
MMASPQDMPGNISRGAIQHFISFSSSSRHILSAIALSGLA